MDAPSVRITLEEPYGKDRHGNEIPVVLRYGFGPARLVTTAVGMDMPDSDEFVDGGAHRQHVRRSAIRYKPGKPNQIELLFCDEERRSAPFPLDGARTLLGDERIAKETEPETDPRWTFGVERHRVALLWGWWKMPSRALNGGTACKKGENDFDLTKIGPPRVPKVSVQKINQYGRAYGEPFRPWDWFQWEADCDYAHPEVAGIQAKPDLSALAGFTLADLEAFVQARRADEKAKAKGDVKHA